MKFQSLRIAIVAVALCFAAPLETFAGDAIKMDVQSADTVKSVLMRQVGKPVKLRLNSGEEMGGVVSKVGDNVLHLSELSGKEYYDAVVRIDAVAAVIIRARGN